MKEINYNQLQWAIQEVYTTREIALKLNIPVRIAYKLLSKEVDKGNLYKYGYRIKDGWQSPDYTNRKCDSLGWQRIK